MPQPPYAGGPQQYPPQPPQQWQYGGNQPPQYQPAPPPYYPPRAPGWGLGSKQPTKLPRKRWIVIGVIAGVTAISVFVGITSTGGSGTGVGNIFNPGSGDVTLVGCAGDDPPTANLHIKNSSSSARSYFITVSFTTDNGANQIDTGIATVNDLAPGQTTDVQAVAISFDAEPYDQCKIVNVSTV
jgi:hypothetical protein